MKRNIAFLIWLMSLGLVAYQQTATLKIGDVIDPVSDTILVPVICEEIEPISGNNEVNIKWFIRYYSNWLNAGEPGGSATLLNVNSTLEEGCITSEILDSTPWGTFQTIAFTCTCPTCGEIFPGEKFFDIQFTLNGGLNNLNIYWSSLGTEDTEMYDDEGNEYYLTLKGGYVGPQPPTATLKIGTIYDPIPGTVLVPVTCEAINPIIGANLVSSIGWYVAYDTSVLYAGEPNSPATLVNYNPEFPPSNYLTNIIADNPAPGWNTIAIIYACAGSGEIFPGDKFFDIPFAYTGGTSDDPNIKWTSANYFQTNMADDEGNEFLLTLEDGYVGPASNDVSFHVTSNGNDLEGAMVTVGNDSIATNNAGLAVFNLQDGEYSYIVTKDGFVDEDSTFIISGAPLQVEVEMENCWYFSIHIISNGGTLTDSALVIVNNDSVWTTTGGASFCVENSFVTWAVYVEGYYPNSGSVILPGPSGLNLNVIMIPISYDVIFFVNCCGQPLSGIPITIDGYTIITPVNGIIVLSLLPGSYSVAIGGYIFNFTIPGSTYIDANICRELTYLVTTEQGYPLENVLISMGTNYLLTNNNGEADTCLQVGSHSYSASKPGFVTQTGTFEMDTIPQTVEILMPLENYAVTLYCSVNCENDFDGLIFFVNGDTVLNGETIYLPNGSYIYNMGLAGCPNLFLPVSGAFIVAGSSMTIDIILPPGFNFPQVTFHVTDQFYDDFEGAAVNVEDDILYTDYLGEVSFCMTGGYHDYWVENPCCDTINNNFIFPCQDTTIEVMLITSTVGEEKLTLFDIYPNPSSGKFSIETLTKTGEPTEIFVTDITGRVVYQTVTTSLDKTEIDLTDQPKGMYFLRVKAGEMVVNRKVVIQ